MYKQCRLPHGITFIYNTLNKSVNDYEQIYICQFYVRYRGDFSKKKILSCILSWVAIHVSKIYIEPKIHLIKWWEKKLFIIISINNPNSRTSIIWSLIWFFFDSPITFWVDHVIWIKINCRNFHRMNKNNVLAGSLIWVTIQIYSFKNSKTV